MAGHKNKIKQLKEDENEIELDEALELEEQEDFLEEEPVDDADLSDIDDLDEEEELDEEDFDDEGESSYDGFQEIEEPDEEYEEYEEDEEEYEEEDDEEEPALSAESSSGFTPEKKKLLTIAGSCAAAAFALGACFSFMFAGGQQKSMHLDSGNMVLKQNTFSVEYGDPVSMNASVYLKSGAERDSVVSCPRLNREYGAELDRSGNLIVDEPVSPGEYDFFIATGDAMTYFVLNVEDTTPPVWKKTETALTFNEGELRTLDFSEYFEADDPSGTQLKVDGDYSLSQAGQYSLRVTAVDGYGNSTDAKTLSLTIKHIDTAEEKEAAQKLKDYDSMAESSENLKKDLAAVRRENDQLKDELDEVTKEKESLEKKLEEFDAKEQEMEKDLETSRQEQKSLQEQFDSLKDQLDKLLGRNNGASSESTSSETASSTSRWFADR